jgi:hypothetical protein
MPMMTRLQVMKAHALLAAFVFPVAIMFMITGVLYTCGIKGSYSKTVYDIQLTEELQPELATLIALAIVELDKLELGHSSGEAKVKSIGSSFMLEWTGSSKDINLEPIDDDLMAHLPSTKQVGIDTLFNFIKQKAVLFLKSMQLYLPLP